MTEQHKRVTCLVTGSRYHGLDALKACMELRPGDRLILIPEPHNRYDACAIRLANMFGQKVGYVDATVSAVVAGWLREGCGVLGRVKKSGRLVRRGPRIHLRYPTAVLWVDRPPRKQSTEAGVQLIKDVLRLRSRVDCLAQDEDAFD